MSSSTIRARHRRAGVLPGTCVASAGTSIATVRPTETVSRCGRLEVEGGGNATEDPPFGGLWCDQPALFLPIPRGVPTAVALCLRRVQIPAMAMDGAQQTAIHQAL